MNDIYGSHYISIDSAGLSYAILCASKYINDVSQASWKSRERLFWFPTELGRVFNFFFLKFDKTLKHNESVQQAILFLVNGS